MNNWRRYSPSLAADKGDAPEKRTQRTSSVKGPGVSEKLTDEKALDEETALLDLGRSFTRGMES